MQGFLSASADFFDAGKAGFLAQSGLSERLLCLQHPKLNYFAVIPKGGKMLSPFPYNM